MDFNQPAEGGDRFPFKDHVGTLALFSVLEYKTGITTSFGEKDAVAADIHVIDGPSAGQVFENSLIFQGAVIGALKGFVGGSPVLARIGQGVAKPGQNPPYVLNPFTQADAQVAGAYWARVQAGQMQQPQAQPVPQPAAAAAPAPAAAYPSAAAASPATGNYQPAPAAAYQPAPAAPAAAPAQQYQPAAAPSAQSEADKFMGYPAEVQLVLIQSGQAPQLSQAQYDRLTVPIQQALQPATAVA